jgi:hypothetical protein
VVNSDASCGDADGSLTVASAMGLLIWPRFGPLRTVSSGEGRWFGKLNGSGPWLFRPVVLNTEDRPFCAPGLGWGRGLEKPGLFGPVLDIVNPPLVLTPFPTSEPSPCVGAWLANPKPPGDKLSSVGRQCGLPCELGAKLGGGEEGSGRGSARGSEGRGSGTAPDCPYVGRLTELVMKEGTGRLGGVSEASAERDWKIYQLD